MNKTQKSIRQNKDFHSFVLLKKRNKQGFLLAEETLKTVLAVIAICFLIYFLVSLYYANSDKKKQEFASASLEDIDKYIEAGRGTAYGIGPSGWYVFGFIKGEKPNSCAGKNCLCICENKWPLFFTSEVKRQAKECSDDGRCLIVENLEAFKEIEIKKAKEGITSIEIKKEDNKIIITEI